MTAGFVIQARIGQDRRWFAGDFGLTAWCRNIAGATMYDSREDAREAAEHLRRILPDCDPRIVVL